MNSKVLKATLFLAISMISTLSFAECGMDRKLELVEEIREIREEKERIQRGPRTAETVRSLEILETLEKEAVNEYVNVCNV